MLAPDSARADDVRDFGERLSADDMATRVEQQFRDAALRAQNLRSGGLSSISGVCTNCGERCLPVAVYCDEECREDHEARLRIERRR